MEITWDRFAMLSVGNLMSMEKQHLHVLVQMKLLEYGIELSIHVKHNIIFIVIGCYSVNGVSAMEACKLEVGMEQKLNYRSH